MTDSTVDRPWSHRAAPVQPVRTQRWPVVLAGALPLAVFALQGHVGFGRSDEGFLWYGVQRVLEGEVPLRDFQSYDIGRYYWAAAWMWLVDSPGLVALRFANALLASATVVIATLLVRTVPGRSAAWTALAAVTFAVWMVPEYKVADSFATVLLIAGLARLLADSGPRGAATFGACLGIAATIGINHALYGTIGGLLGYAFLAWKGERPLRRDSLVALATATVAGYAPVLVFMAFVPGFAAAFVDAIRLLLEAGTTNVELPVPSPLAVFERGEAAFVGALRASLFSIVYHAAPWLIAFGLWCAARDARTTGRDGLDLRCGAVFAAAVLLAIPYAHYVHSSAGTTHLAVSGLPFVVAAWTVPLRRNTAAVRVVRLALLPASLFFLVHAYAGYPWLRGRPLEPVVVLGDRLRVSPDAAAELRLVKRLTDAHPGRRFFAAPDWPGAYASVHQRAPNWEIFEIFTARPERQRREIERLRAANPAFAIITTRPPDGLDKTHPDLLRYVRTCFTRQESIRTRELTADVFREAGRRCDPI